MSDAVPDYAERVGSLLSSKSQSESECVESEYNWRTALGGAVGGWSHAGRDLTSESKRRRLNKPVVSQVRTLALF